MKMALVATVGIIAAVLLVVEIAMDTHSIDSGKPVPQKCQPLSVPDQTISIVPQYKFDRSLERLENDNWIDKQEFGSPSLPELGNLPKLVNRIDLEIQLEPFAFEK
jgi:hypothetical protein